MSRPENKNPNIENQEAQLYTFPVIDLGTVALLSEVEVDYWIVHTKGFGRLPKNGEEILGSEF